VKPSLKVTGPGQPSFRPAADPARTPWQEGSTIPYAGRVFSEVKVEAAVSATLDFWLMFGSEGAAMDKELEAFLGVRHCLLVNFGSSANLMAISAPPHLSPTAEREST
jgi:CDP-6-deoxy-D-xylo-4-hexulose-3-dehydrase